jgi:branched-chain amino acid transport system permease protein
MRRAGAAFVVLVAALAAAPSAGHADGSVDRQAWTRTGPVPTFVATAGHIYVAADVGNETARAFVHVDPTAIGPGAVLTVSEDATGSTLADTAAVMACPLASELTAAGTLTVAASPAADCTATSPATRAADGTWSVPLDPFLERWQSAPAFGVALVPVLAQAATFHLSFDTSKTSLAPGTAAPPTEAPGSAPASTEAAPATSTSDAVAPDLSSPSTLSALTGAEAGISPVPPSMRLNPSARQGRAASPAAAVRPIGAASPPAALVLALVGVGALGAARTWSRRRARSGVTQAADGAAERTQNQIGIRQLTLALSAVALVLGPTLLGEATVYKLGLVLIFIVGAIGLHLLVNWVGELSLAHAALVGLPAFVVVKLSADHGLSPIYLLPVGLVVGLVAGGVVGLPAIRARGLQVALVTLAAGVAIDRFFFTKDWIVGGVAGAQSAVPRLGPFTFATARSLYPVLGFFVVLSIAAAWAIYRSKIGRGFLWVKAHPDAAAAFGVPVARYRTLAYVLAGGFAGFAGGLTAMWVQRLTPQAFPLTKSFTYLIVVALAGRGFVGGVAAAASFVEGGRLFLPNADAVLTYGAPLGLIVTLTRHPTGINGLGRQLAVRIQTAMHIQTAGRIRKKEPSMDREIKGLNVRPLLGAGAVLLAVGFAAIGLAWYHAGNTSQVWIQNQELISGGVGGLALVVVGIGLLVYDRVLALRAADSERWERLIDALAAQQTAAPAPARRRARRSAV